MILLLWLEQSPESEAVDDTSETKAVPETLHKLIAAELWVTSDLLCRATRGLSKV